jgi:hypothetical protein
MYDIQNIEGIKTKLLLLVDVWRLDAPLKLNTGFKEYQKLIIGIFVMINFRDMSWLTFGHAISHYYPCK